MEDSKNILPNGSGTPYLAIFDGNEKPIYDPKSKLPIGVLVTNFFYEYNEEEEDKSEITLECNNPNLIDVPSLAIQMPLLLQWGWLFSDSEPVCGPVRKVVIRDTEVNFLESSVRVVLKCTDAFSLTKVMPADLEQKTMLQWLKNNISGKFDVEIVDYKVTPTMGLPKKQIR